MGADRLGSVTYRGYGGAASYYPYGEEETPTANDTQKFATYTRDSATGLDYAQNRYYASQIGRFTTADPYVASGGSEAPQGWNRYAYVQNDPVNYGDPSGLTMISANQDELVCIDVWNREGWSERCTWVINDSPNAAQKPHDCTSDFPGFEVTFVQTNYQGAADVASEYTSSDADTLTVAFLDWGAWETGWSTKALWKKNHNFFGMHPGQWGGLTNVPCPEGAVRGAQCFAPASYEAELTAALGNVPHTITNHNRGNLSYGGFLRQALANDPNASAATLLQAIATAGWNAADPNYGSTLNQLTDTMKDIISCLKSLGRI
jgi:RHS repeat-associated protein